MKLALRNPAGTSILLLVLSILSTFLPVLSGQYVFAALVIALITLAYYGVAVAWLWSAYRLASPLDSVKLSDRIMFWLPPILFAGQKFTQRYQSFNIIANGSYSYISKFIISAAFVLLLVCVFRVAIAIESRINGGKLPWSPLVGSAVSLIFLPIGVWLVWPKLKKINSIDGQ